MKINKLVILNIVILICIVYVTFAQKFDYNEKKKYLMKLRSRQLREEDKLRESIIKKYFRLTENYLVNNDSLNLRDKILKDLDYMLPYYIGKCYHRKLGLIYFFYFYISSEHAMNLKNLIVFSQKTDTLISIQCCGWYVEGSMTVDALNRYKIKFYDDMNITINKIYLIFNECKKSKKILALRYKIIALLIS